MKINKKFFTVIALSSFLIASSQLIAENKDQNSTMIQSAKIMIIDSGKLLQDSSVFQDIQKQIENKQNEIKQMTDKNTPSLKKEYQDLESQKNILSEAEFKKKAEALEKKTVELDKKIYVEHTSIKDGYEQAMSKVSDKILDIIKKESENKKYDLILDRGAVHYYNPSLDITNTILSSLNSEMSSIKVSFEQKTPESSQVMTEKNTNNADKIAKKVDKAATNK